MSISNTAELVALAKREGQREAKKYRKALEELTASVWGYLSQVDLLMKQPDSHERGKKLASLSNQLELANDRARHFTLGIDLRTGKKRR
jgi:hypothetical protein